VCLYNLGLIKSHCHFINNPEQLVCIQCQLEVLRSLGQAEEFERLALLERMADQVKVKVKLLALDLDAAIVMLCTNKTTTSKFQKKHTRAILVSVFEVCPKNGVTNKELLASLEETATTFPNQITEYSSKQPVLSSIEPLPTMAAPNESGDPTTLGIGPDKEETATA